MKLLRGHPLMGELVHDLCLCIEKEPGLQDPNCHPNQPAYGFGKTRGYILEPINFAHNIVMLILHQKQPHHSVPPLDLYKINFLHYFSFIPTFPVLDKMLSNRTMELV